MNIHDFPKLNNLTSKDLRDVAKKIRYFSDYSKELYLEVFKEVSPLHPDLLFDFFVENNLLEKAPNDKWSSSVILRAIAGASLEKRKNHSQSWNEVAKLLARTVVLSKDLQWNIDTPSHLFLFGSMLNPDKKDYGDADLSLFITRKDDYQVLLKSQKEWLKKFYDFTSSKAYSSFGFLHETQLRLDMLSASSFPSVHAPDDIFYLSKEPYNLGNFPLMILWENKDFPIHTPEIIEAKNLSDNWKSKNPDSYSSALESLNSALFNLGIKPLHDKDFESSCENYIVNSLSSELIHKLQSSTKENRDVIITNKIVRFGETGYKAIFNALKNIDTSHLKNSKISQFILNHEEELKDYFIKTNTVRQKRTI